MPTLKIPLIRPGERITASYLNTISGAVDGRGVRQGEDVESEPASPFTPEDAVDRTPAESIIATEISRQTADYTLDIVDDTGTSIGTVTIQAITNILFLATNGQAFSFTIDPPT